MISLSQINQFCATDGGTFAMSGVHLEQEDHLFIATNGKVLVSVSIDEVEGVDSNESVLPCVRSRFPDWRAIMRDQWTDEIPTAAPVLEGEWKDYVYKDHCIECEGTGLFDCNCPNCLLESHECKECDGTGEVECWQDWTGVLPCGLSAKGHFLWQIQGLPDVRWFAPVAADASRPVPFAFGETGRGLLMPMRPTDPINPAS